MWAFYAVLASIGSCAYYFANQTTKTSPKIFLMYRGFIPFLILLPLVPFFEPITDWRFYLACTLQGFIVSYIDYKTYRSIRTWGAEIVSSIQPFAIGFVFVMWLIISPITILRYIERPISSIFIILALIAVIYSVSSFRKSKKSAKAFKYLIPYLFAMGACDVLNKLAMSYTQGHPETGVVIYIMILGFVIGTLNLIMHLKQGEKLGLIISKNNLKLTLVGVVALLPQIFKNLGMYNTSNPSYVTAIIYLYIVWIMLINMYLKKKGKITQYKQMETSKVLILLMAIVVLTLLRI